MTRRLIHAGDGFLLERLPERTRVLFPPAPLAALPDVAGAVRAAVDAPLGCEPLRALARPGMRVTIAVDDVSLPLPRMRRPDARETVLRAVLAALDQAGVDDVHIVAAIGLHRKVKPAELRAMVGGEIFRAFHPARLYNHDAEDPDGIVSLGTTSDGDPVELNRRAAESDLVIYVSITWVPMNGGHKSIGVGLASYRTIARSHHPRVLADTPTYMAPETSKLHAVLDRVGRFVESRLRVFHVEVALDNRMFDRSLDFLGSDEENFGAADWAKLAAMRAALAAMPSAARRRALQAVPAAYQVIDVKAGATEPVHAAILARAFEQYTVPVAGQSDIVITGIPYVSPYSVGAALNPLLVQLMGLGYLFSMHRGTPVLARGGTLILCHPCRAEFDDEQHACYREFFERVLPETRDAHQMHRRFEPAFAADPRWIERYRFGHAYHGAHPFYMWYWGEAGRRHAGRVIAAGAEDARVTERLGWERAPDLAAAIAMARETAPGDPSITLLHHPPAFIADVRA